MTHRNSSWVVPVVLLFGLFAILSTAASVSAAVIHVPADQPTIQAGIDAAVTGDTVLVADGVYTGPGNRDIDFLGKDITVKSENGPLHCIIDCQGSAGAEPHRGFRLHNGETTAAVIEGFTIRNGYVTGSFPANCGGGINLQGAEGATIRNNRIENCHADSDGGGVFVWHASVLLVGNTIKGCDAYAGGGACVGTGPIFRDNLICDNTAYRGGGLYGSDIVLQNDRIIGNQAVDGGGVAELFGSFSASNSLIAGNHADNDGGGVWVDDYSVIQNYNCSVVGNTAGNRGGGFYIDTFGVGWFDYFDCIIWGNTPDSIDGDFWQGDFYITYTDIEGGWPGEGNIDADPLFVTGPFGDWYLSQTAAGQAVDSPCLDAGHGLASTLCYQWTSSGVVTCMGDRTTRSDQALDTGLGDLGYHYPAAGSVSAGLVCLPAMGTMPFSPTMEVTLTNRVASQTRRVAGRIDLQLAGGGYLGNWRSGYTDVFGNSNYYTIWNQSIPLLGALIGDNEFTLHVMDVTPAPWNQPPYPPAGDVASDNCTVTGIAP